MIHLSDKKYFMVFLTKMFKVQIPLAM